jgi:hypothetical protein
VIPRSSSAHVQHGPGAPLISLNALTGHRSRREGCPGRTSTSPATTDTGFRCRSGRSKLLPLEIGVQAIKPSPYRADPPARRPGHLGPATGFLACSGPLRLSAPGEPSDPADLPSSLSRLQRGCAEAPRGALVALDGEQVVTPGGDHMVGVVVLARLRFALPAPGTAHAHRRGERARETQSPRLRIMEMNETG